MIILGGGVTVCSLSLNGTRFLLRIQQWYEKEQDIKELDVFGVIRGSKRKKKTKGK